MLSMITYNESLRVAIKILCALKKCLKKWMCRVTWYLWETTFHKAREIQIFNSKIFLMMQLIHIYVSLCVKSILAYNVHVCTIKCHLDKQLFWFHDICMVIGTACFGSWYFTYTNYLCGTTHIAAVRTQ